MVLASVYYLGTTLIMFALFVLIVVRTYSRKNREQGENPKFRMMDDDSPLSSTEKAIDQEVTHVR